MSEFHCHSCAKRKPVSGSKLMLIQGVATRVCRPCSGRISKSFTISWKKSQLVAPNQRAHGHTPNSNSTPRLPGSLGRATFTGPAKRTRKTKITIAPTPRGRFDPDPDFIGEFQLEFRRLTGSKT
jgi:hypothetical protein